jgi:hypothetical protein
VGRWGSWVEFLCDAQLGKRFVDSAERQKKKHGEIVAPERITRGQSHRAAEARFGPRPLRFARLHHP